MKTLVRTVIVVLALATANVALAAPYHDHWHDRGRYGYSHHYRGWHGYRPPPRPYYGHRYYHHAPPRPYYHHAPPRYYYHHAPRGYGRYHPYRRW